MKRTDLRWNHHLPLGSRPPGRLVIALDNHRHLTDLLFPVLNKWHKSIRAKRYWDDACWFLGDFERLLPKYPELLPLLDAVKLGLANKRRASPPAGPPDPATSGPLQSDPDTWRALVDRAAADFGASDFAPSELDDCGEDEFETYYSSPRTGLYGRSGG
jgi:hypothetical protein